MAIQSSPCLTCTFHSLSLLSLSQDIEFADQLMEEWFTVVHEKNRLVKEEADVVYMLVSVGCPTHIAL